MSGLFTTVRPMGWCTSPTCPGLRGCGASFVVTRSSRGRRHKAKSTSLRRVFSVSLLMRRFCTRPTSAKRARRRWNSAPATPRVVWAAGAGPVVRTVTSPVQGVAGAPYRLELSRAHRRRSRTRRPTRGRGRDARTTSQSINHPAVHRNGRPAHPKRRGPARTTTRGAPHDDGGGAAERCSRAAAVPRRVGCTDHEDRQHHRDSLGDHQAPRYLNNELIRPQLSGRVVSVT